MSENRIKYLVVLSLFFGLLGQKGVARTGPVKSGTGDSLILPSDRFLPPVQVRVGGILGDAIGLSEQGRMRTLPRWQDGALIRMFSEAVRSRNKTYDWYGEHAGKWLCAASLAAARTGDDSLRQLLLSTADYLVSQQAPDGYLGSYSASHRITNRALPSQKRSWDVWTLSYMTLGLLQVNTYFPCEKYLNAARHIGELLLKTFGDGTVKVTDYGTRYGYSATVVLDPVVELYKTTKDKRYLDFALRIIQEVEQKQGLRFLDAALHNRDMETVADGKAYQVIWNIAAVVKLYEVTGTHEYLQAAAHAWQNILENHLTVTGGPWGGIGKHLECFNTKGFWSPYGYVETCSVMAWLQLNEILLRITGEAKYAQEIEKSAYNALLGAQLAGGQDWTYHSFANGPVEPANFNDCCPSSGMLALEELPQVICTHRQNGIACNLYSAGDITTEIAAGGRVQLREATGYPFSGEIRLEITAAKAGQWPLFIRIPAWAGGTVVTVNGKPVPSETIRPGAYLTIVHDWKGKHVVELDFPWALRVTGQEEAVLRPQSKETLYKVSWCSMALGPLVYASDGLINDKDREWNFAVTRAELERSFHAVAAKDTVPGQAYRLEATGIKPLLFRPFFEAGGRLAGRWRLTWLQNKIE